MSGADLPVIAGAGPVGLAAALFLARRGRAVRLVETRTSPAGESKALAVNPRTLAILEATGVTARILERGAPIRGVQFHRAGRVVARLPFEGIDPTYPFMVALSQATTERLLAEALTAAGGEVERGVRMTYCQNVDNGVEVVLERDGKTETARCPWLLAADGAHSAARKALGVDFVGSAFADDWHLSDMPLKTVLPEDHGHFFFLEDGGFLFLIRVHGNAAGATEHPLWRVLGNHVNPVSRLAHGEPAGPPVWTSRFRVAHRVGETFAAGNVYFAGDAAHVHSPVGGRGMNLGVEDAYVFAQLVGTKRLLAYDRLRRPVDRAVVRKVEILSKVVAGDTPFYRFMRSFMLPRVLTTPALRARMIATITGLDHELGPRVPA